MGKKGYRGYEKKGFKTPSGKVEFYSELLNDLRYDSIPTYRPREQPPEYLLILVTGYRCQEYPYKSIPF
ncbi:MAG: hypothetical protein QXR62_04980 [Candidatus Bathyarchaeia archaeon]